MKTVGGILPLLQVSTDSSPYQNPDVLPLPPSRRTWSIKVFIFFWLATAINIAEWSGASTALAIGLTVGQAIAVNAISTIIICMALVINGHGGGKWHISFAVINRTGWGVRGAWFSLCARIILSCCWYGVQAWYGGQMVKIMIGAIWPSFYRMRNTFAPDAAMKTNEFIAFIIFWTISLPIFLLRPEQYRIPAICSSVVVTIAAFALFIWALAKQGNVGPLWSNPEVVYGTGRLKGSVLSWAMMRMISSGIGGWAGGILYQSDFSRYAVKSGDQIWGQVFIIPVCLFGSNILGIITTSCARGFYPDEPLLWKLYDLLEAIQMHEGPGARAAVFFAAFAFFLSQVCVNVVACGVVGGMDLAALLPRYINIRRGSFIIAIIGICINPWKILNTANSFISAISAYAVFLGPLSGIMITEYHIIRRRQIKLSHLFMPNSGSDYWFWHGVNWRAPIIWALGVWPSMPGFCASITPNVVKVSTTWTHVYYMSWLLGFFISSSLWILVNNIWPPPGVGEIDDKDVFGTFGPAPRNSSDSVNEEDGDVKDGEKLKG
ncbi:hypothetical protein PC9H_000146 [Pleurotus ostreatus]|uniref:Uncharacterized protein n=1 Tax=Pleurotus ostreatus TaxID=5322 RepID=A0A8H7A0J6_PLEOS|nr:uncharacterized protein PC9H_000146 [Pleurotus ostreatus]KAF7439810.1 hypothetical protein PC9H_000146 [Pleurotus ostreatus]KAJ8701018.1 hypothetical protein PTI98_003986 [Pleurotus ostreatus]